MNENNIQLTDQELRCLVYFINMKLPEFGHDPDHSAGERIH